jgi:hypothetical protein
MLFDSLNNLLEHIKEVEQDTIKISQEAQMKLSSFIERNKIQIDDEAAEALQYQDIVSQQLTATIEAIELVQKNLQMFAHNFREDEKIADDSVDKLRSKMDLVLEQARSKKEAFSGRLKNQLDEQEIEFF